MGVDQRADDIRPTHRRDRRIGALLVLLTAVVALLLLVAKRQGPPKTHSAALSIKGAFVFTVHGYRVSRIPLSRVTRDGTLDATRVNAELARVLPRTFRLRDHGALLTLRLSRWQAARVMLGLGPRGGEAALTGVPIASEIGAPTIRERPGEDSDSAALAVLLATTGLKADRLALERRLSANPPPDLPAVGNGRRSHDKERRAGGPVPIAASWLRPRLVAEVAARYQRRLGRLTGARPVDVYNWVRSGRAVMAWVADPPRSWRTGGFRPAWRIRDERAVVLAGIRQDGMLSVVNPERGTREWWDRGRFQAMWGGAGRKALGA